MILLSMGSEHNNNKGQIQPKGSAPALFLVSSWGSPSAPPTPAPAPWKGLCSVSSWLSCSSLLPGAPGFRAGVRGGTCECPLPPAARGPTERKGRPVSLALEQRLPLADLHGCAWQELRLTSGIHLRPGWRRGRPRGKMTPATRTQRASTAAGSRRKARQAPPVGPGPPRPQVLEGSAGAPHPRGPGSIALTGGSGLPPAW